MRDWTALGVRCPRCLEALAAHERTLRCGRCRAEYPVHFGIPDLRTGNDPYLSREEDLAAARALASRPDDLAFSDLLASYYAGNDKVPPDQVALFTQGTLAAGERAARSVALWERHDQSAGAARRANARLLDVGCGTAPLAIAAARAGWDAIGIDVGLRWLVLAQRRMREAGSDIPLVCANAELLPFENASVARVAGESILENTTDPEQALHEMSRVLTRGGRLWLTTPNKRSLGPDPHLGVFAGGWWPDALLRSHADRSGKVFPRRTLFTAAELRSALDSAGFRDTVIDLPEIAAAQLGSRRGLLRGAITAYQLARRAPGARALLRAVAPTYLLSATRA